MKIQKSTDSEVFDQYATIMQKFLQKRANWASEIFEGVSSGAKSLADALTQQNKNIDDFIIELSRQGKDPLEIAKITGRNPLEVEEIASGSKALPSGGAGVAKEIIEESDALEEVSMAVKNKGREVATLASEVSNLEGMSLEEVSNLYKELKKSRDGMKGQISLLRNSLNKAINESDVSAAELAAMSETLQNSQRLLASSEDEVQALLRRIEELGGKLDESGNIARGLQGELDAAREGLGAAKTELSASQRIIEDLTAKGLALEEENRRLLQQIADNKEIAAYNADLLETLKINGEENTLAGRLAQEIAEQAETQATEASTILTERNPSLASVISQVSAQATQSGQTKASQVIQAAQAISPVTPAGGQQMIKLKPVTPSAPAKTTPGQPTPTSPVPAQPTTPSSPQAKPSPAANTPKPVAPATPAAPTAPKTKTPAAPASGGSTTITTKSPAPGVTPPAAKATPKPSVFQQLMLKNSPSILSGLGSIVGTGAKGLFGGGLYVLKFLAIAGLITGAYLAYKYWSQANPEAAKRTVDGLKNQQYDTLTKLRQLRFKNDSAGEAVNNDLIGKITTSFRTIELLNDPENLTEESYNKILSDLDNMESAVKEYLQNQENLSKDLLDPAGFSGAIQSLRSLQNQILEIKQNVMESVQDYNEGTSHIMPVPNERGIETPLARPGQPTKPSQEPGTHVPQILDIGGQQVDIGQLTRGARSAAPRIVEKVLNTPEGQAFLDPDNVWGGWLEKIPVVDEQGNTVEDKSADYLRALKYLYLNKIFDRGDLRKFVRDNLPRVGRRRMSGWRDAIKYYSGHEKNNTNSRKNKKITQNMEKPANYSRSGVIHKQDNFLEMKKQADQFSKEYFQDAIQGLEDQYAKSYYAGLKGMHDQKPEKTEADYKKMYQVHQETGADLISEAHPFTIDIAEAMGNGGIVENQIEQQRHNIGVAKSMPSGNIRGKHAWIIQNLVKLANHADERGDGKASDLIDAVLQELTS